MNMEIGLCLIMMKCSNTLHSVHSLKGSAKPIKNSFWFIILKGFWQSDNQLSCFNTLSSWSAFRRSKAMVSSIVPKIILKNPTWSSFPDRCSSRPWWPNRPCIPCTSPDSSTDPRSASKTSHHLKTFIASSSSWNIKNTSVSPSLSYSQNSSDV